MNDLQFLKWIYDRMNYVYSESENTDFMLRFKDILENMQKDID